MMIAPIGYPVSPSVSAWSTLPSAFKFEPPAADALALEGPTSAEDDRAIAADNFGFIDSVGEGSALDGLATRKEFQRAGNAGVLRGEQADLILAIADDEARFRALDELDGRVDDRVMFSALVEPQRTHAAEVPTLFEARYADEFVALFNALIERSEKLDREAVAALSKSSLSVTAFRLLDAFDGRRDEKVDATALRAAFEPQRQVFEQPSAAGQGSVMQASMSALMADYKNIQENDSTPEDDRTRLAFARALSARNALESGVPMEREGLGLDADIEPDFIAAALLDDKAVNAEFDRLLSHATIQADLAQKIRDNTPNLESRVREIESRISSPLYADRLVALEREGRSQEAKGFATRDLAALRLLDEQAAQRASARLLENMTGAVIDEGDFQNTPSETASIAISDTLEVMLGLKAARVALRETGRINTLINTLDDIKAEFLMGKEAITRMGQNLANLFNYTQAAGGKVSDAPRLMQDLEMPAMKAAIDDAERSKMRGLIDRLDRAGVWQTGAAIFGVIGGAYRLAHPGATPWDRMYAAQEFLAAASYTTGPAKALGQYLHKTRDAGSGFHAAMKTSLVELVKPSMAYSGYSSGADSVDGSVIDKPATQVGGKHRAAAAFVKGFATITEVGSAVMGIAIGAKVIADGVAQGDAGQQVLGSITLTSGVTTMVGATLASAFAIGTPLLVGGGVLSLVGVIASLALQKSGDQVTGDQLAEAWGEGCMKDGWREALRDWWVAHTPAKQGLGLDL